LLGHGDEIRRKAWGGKGYIAPDEATKLLLAWPIRELKSMKIIWNRFQRRFA
jgi:hypothetical protein